ncbi:hypothetical protein ACQPZJ_44565 [Actinoplanes sp. CA-054009]
MPSATALGREIKRGLSITDRLPESIKGFGDDFEAWLTFLGTDQPWHDQETRLRNKASFAAVARAIGHQIDGATLITCSASATPPPWLEKLVRNWMVADPNALVITFNYDTLIELTYIHTLGTIFSASPEALYGVRIPPIALRFTGAIPAPGRWRPFRLAKLHGSTNWYYAGWQAPTDTAIYDIGLPGSWGDNAAGWNDRSLRLRGSSALLDLEPLIVPPTLAKGPYYGNRQLAAQWALAARHLEATDELVCIGFSLPAADTMVRSLLATRFTGNVVVVNPDLGVLDRYHDLFGAGRVDHTFCGVADPILRYVDTLPEVSDGDIDALDKTPTDLI